MEDEKCSDVLGGRKRTESNGGNSDSDLSDGWNIVDHLDTNSQELPSSDGESVEVIDGDDDIPQSGDADLCTEEDGSATEAFPIVSQSDCSTAVMSVDEPPSEVLPPHREEMFDSPFCRFLLTASLAVLASHLALLATQSVFIWSTTGSYDFDFYMTDVPTTTPPLPQNNLADKISWASNEEVNVELVDDTSDEEPGNTVVSKLSVSADNVILSKETKNVEKLPIKIDNHELRKQFIILSEMTTSVEARRKFAQAMLIIDSLHIDIYDLEEIVTDSSELNHILEKQKNKINDVLTEVKFGVSRTLERVATNVFNKIKNMERRFEKELCKLEQNGYKEKMKELIYDCEEFRNGSKMKSVGNKKQFEKIKAKTVIKEEHRDKKKMVMDGYKYEVDKDSTGKVHSKEKSGNGENNDYYKLVKKEKINRNKIKHKLYDPTHYNEINSHKFKNNKKKESRKRYNLKHPLKNKINNERYIKKEKHTTKSGDRNFRYSKEPVIKKSIEEVVSNILKEMCMKNKNAPTKSGDYHQLKEEVDKKLKISKELFEKMYMKFCVHNSDTIKKKYSKQINKDNVLKNNNLRDNSHIIETPSTKNILNFKISNYPEKSRQDVNTIYNSVKDKVIEPVNQNEWTLSYETTSPVNKTNGEWFLKSGESRSHVRWSHQRSDWWFDRSFQRRHYQYNYPHPSNWFVGRRKNWFFRRAWARQQCKESSHNNWCHLDDDTVTIPNSNLS